MLREEAIKVLKKELQIRTDQDFNFTMTRCDWDEHDDNMIDALEMAIDALREEE